MAEDQIRHCEHLARNEGPVAEARLERRQPPGELGAGGLLHLRDAQSLGQSKAMLGRRPDRPIDLVDGELGEAVLDTAFERAGRMGELAVAVGQKLQDRD